MSYRALILTCAHRRFVRPVVNQPRWTDYVIPTDAQRTRRPVRNCAGRLSVENRGRLKLASRVAWAEPGEPQGWLLLADVCQNQLGRPDWAVKALRTSLVFIPGHPLLRLALRRAKAAERPISRRRPLPLARP